MSKTLTITFFDKTVNEAEKLAKIYGVKTDNMIEAMVAYSAYVSRHRENMPYFEGWFNGANSPPIIINKESDLSNE